MDADETREQSSRRWVIAGQWLALLVGVALVVYWEWARLRELEGRPWLVGIDVRSTPYLPLLVLLPLCWFVRRPMLTRTRGWGRRLTGWLRESPERSTRSGLVVAWALALSVGATSLCMSHWVASYTSPAGGRAQRGEAVAFGDLPPAYHDEYAYLLQAETFLSGRLWFPSHAEMPRLFDQMHVLNEGKIASRYFPGTAVWIAPFLAVGEPYWGHWFAGAVVAFFVFWSGRELACSGVGLLAGFLTAVAPGMALFSNLLLAHHPTLVGLSVFVYAFLRMMRTGGTVPALAAGTGLVFAMYCRPMTAAGCGLPFGLWMAVHWMRSIRRRAPGDPWRWRLPLALAAPLLAGFVLLFFYNRAITGDGLLSPYQYYTEKFTPRHMYGFNNVERAQELLNPRVIENYDRWAKNLTPELAWENVTTRFRTSLTWTLGVVPLVTAGIVLLFGLGRLDRRWWLVPAAILSLHLAHVPYWYEGIMGYHYVFETGPLWCLVFAGATLVLVRWWRVWNRPWMPVWWGAFVSLALVVMYTSCDPLWSPSPVAASIEEKAFSRRIHKRVREVIERAVPDDERALILVRKDPAARHIDLVINGPRLDGRILMGGYQPETMDLSKIAAVFPDRSLWILDQQTLRIERVKIDDRSPEQTDDA